MLNPPTRHRTEKGSIRGFTGLLVLARTPEPLTSVHPLAGHHADLVGARDDGWQIAALSGHAEDTTAWATALVAATAALRSASAVSGP